MPSPPPRASRSWRAALPALAVVLLGLVALCALVTAPAARGAARGSAGRAAEVARADERKVILFYTAEVHGTVEPCGCTSDPLGDVSRLAAVVARARAQGAGVALVDAGNLSYPEGAISPRERASAKLRADFLATELERIGLLGAALGETDVPVAGGQLRPERLASNLEAAIPGVRPPRVHRVGQVAVGVLGVVEPAVASVLGARATDMTEAARHDVRKLREEGAELVVLLAPVDRSAARKLARTSGADVVVLGKRVEKGMPRLERIGRAILVAPEDELQRVGRLEIVLRRPAAAVGGIGGGSGDRGAGAAGGGGGLDLQDAGGPEASRLRREEISRALERLKVGLTKWTSTGAAGAGASHKEDRPEALDRAFVAAKQQEQAALETERASLQIPWTPPTAGSYVVDELLPLGRGLPRDPVVAAAMRRLDQAIATVNLKQAVPPPPPEPGRAFYVGSSKCAGCHTAATAFWRRTVHAHAWRTLVEGGKQADYKCVGCHATGFGQVGGSSLGFTRNLENVQCENCHGPGSVHVAGEGNEEPLAVKRDAPETLCLGCHTEQHSDTFDYVPYLRDIVGPGHAPKRREQLGPGPTGHELRTTALARAKLADAARLKKM